MRDIGAGGRRTEPNALNMEPRPRATSSPRRGADDPQIATRSASSASGAVLTSAARLLAPAAKICCCTRVCLDVGGVDGTRTRGLRRDRRKS